MPMDSMDGFGDAALRFAGVDDGNKGARTLSEAEMGWETELCQAAEAAAHQKKRTECIVGVQKISASVR